MSRKTIAIDKVLDFANAALGYQQASDDELSGGINRRWGVIGLVESALHATGNYRGFRYLASEFHSDGTLRPGYDETRRAYFYPPVKGTS